MGKCRCGQGGCGDGGALRGYAQGHPGTARDSQGHPGTPRDSQRQPETARDTQGHPGTPRDTQGHPETARDTQGHPETHLQHGDREVKSWNCAKKYLTACGRRGASERVKPCQIT